MKNFFKASVITGSAFAINLAFNVIRAKIVAVLLGPAGVAVLAQLGGFTTLVITLSSLGLATAIVRFVAEYKASHRHTDLKALIATIVVYVTLSTIVITVAMLVLLPLVSRLVFGQEVLFGLIALSLFNIPVSVVTNVAVGVLQGFKEIKLDAAFSVFSTVAAGIILIALIIPFGLTGAVVAGLIANYLTSAIFFVFVLRALESHLDVNLKPNFSILGSLSRHFSLSSLRPLMGIAIASLIGGGISNLADILVRSHLIQTKGLIVAGSVQPALALSTQYTALLAGAMSTYAIPRLSELANHKPQLQKEFKDYARLMLLIVTPFAIAVAVTAKYTVPLLYSAKFSNSIPLIPVQSVADVMEFAFISQMGVFMAMGRGKIILFLSAAAPLVYYGSYLLLLPHIGLISIPIASGVSWICVGIFAYFILRNILGLHFGQRNIWLGVTSSLAAVFVALSMNLLTWWAGASLSVLILLIWSILNVSRSEIGQAWKLLNYRMART